VASGPRHHLYRTGRFLIEVGLFWVGFNPELDHFCDFADNFDFAGTAEGGMLNQRPAMAMAERTDALRVTERSSAFRICAATSASVGKAGSAN